MWKKDEVTPDQPTLPATATMSRPGPPLGGAPARSRASIGSSITIRGEVTGDEDLLIEGKVDGSVDLKQHSVTVGSEGQVKAGITGRVVTVEGTVHGDLRAEEMVVLRSSAHVQGDISAPRVVLEDGATFRGAVDMGEAADMPKRRASGVIGEANTTPPSGAPKTRSSGDAGTAADKSGGGPLSDAPGAKSAGA